MAVQTEKTKNDFSKGSVIGNILKLALPMTLAQLVNVLKGDMSIVGPRPPLPREVEQYDAYTFQRLYVTPGLSCYWQIQPHRNDLSFEEWVDLDIQYIQERSFVTDWKIIFKTVLVMFTRQGE